MEILIWIGAVLSLCGIAAIIYSIFAVVRAKRAGLDEDALRARLSRILPINLVGLFISVIGLMTVIMGVSLS